MATQKDKVGIFLTVIIVLLIVATAVYAFVYREKIAETIQKFTKKDNKEVYEIRTTKRSDITEEFSPKPKKSMEEDLLLSDSKIDKPKENPKISPPIFEPEDRVASNLKEKETKTKSGKLRLSEPEDKFLDPTESPYRKSAAKLGESPKTEELHSEFAETPHSKKKSRARKFQKRSRVSHKKPSLEKRVRDLEEKFGVRPKRHSSLEKRISRLEKLEKRVIRLEKIAAKKEKEE